jgi:4-hydroxy-tetrahydrodipicolinate reductase
MKIILLGYGKMGKIIEGIAVHRGHKIAARIDIENAADFESAQGDVAIEILSPGSSV